MDRHVDDADARLDAALADARRADALVEAQPFGVWRHFQPWMSLSGTEGIAAKVAEILLANGLEALSEAVAKGDGLALFEAARASWVVGDGAVVTRQDWQATCLWLALRADRYHPRLVQAYAGLTTALALQARESTGRDRDRILSVISDLWIERGDRLLDEVGFDRVPGWPPETGDHQG